MSANGNLAKIGQNFFYKNYNFWQSCQNLSKFQPFENLCKNGILAKNTQKLVITAILPKFAKIIINGNPAKTDKILTENGNPAKIGKNQAIAEEGF